MPVLTRGAPADSEPLLRATLVGDLLAEGAAQKRFAIETLLARTYEFYFRFYPLAIRSSQGNPAKYRWLESGKSNLRIADCDTPDISAAAVLYLSRKYFQG